jgi:dihydroorotase
MPNTLPPVLTARDAHAYRREIEAFQPEFETLMTLKLTEEMTPQDVEEAARQGITAIKQYPAGVTTNSSDGITDLTKLYPIYETMQAANLVLCVHGERPGVFVLDAETEFLKDVAPLIRDFPRLRIVLEHLSTEAAVHFVAQGPPTLAATITDHHLDLTLDDVVGSRIQPHHFCMPVAKRPRDREALWQVIQQAHPRFFSGTDSAPHVKEEKESACGCAGIFTSASHLPLLAHLFETHGCLDRLKAFTSRFGAEFYQLPLQTKETTLVKKPHQVPQILGGIVPFRFGTVLPWSMASTN